MLDAICTHVTSSAASRDRAVTFTTDSYQIWVVQKYDDAFSKSSSIYFHRNIGSLVTYLTYHASQDKFFVYRDTINAKASCPKLNLFGLCKNAWFSCQTLM